MIRTSRWGQWAALILSLSGCLRGPGEDPEPKVVCTTDDQCALDEVCFADGCGDPGRDIAVELTPNNRAGQHAQDFAIDKLQAKQDFRLIPATVLLGNVSRVGLADPETGTPGPSVPYDGGVSVRIFGESAIIPGLHRSFELNQELVGGNFAMSAASGRYQGTISTADSSIPPQQFTSELAPGEQTTLNLALPAADQITQLQGQMVGPLLPLVGETYLLEAFSTAAAPEEQPIPLAQPARTNALTAAFTLSLPVSAIDGVTPILLRATPVQTLTQTPTRVFELIPAPETYLQLALGPFGLPVMIRGRAVDGMGRPVMNATVYVDAVTSVGATARSPSVRTAADGTFSVQVLPNPTQANAIWVVPQARDAAGQASFFYPIGETSQDVGDLTLPWRTPTRVSVRSPDDLPADSAVVVAEPIDAIEGRSIPSFRREEVTAADGTIVLWLEPGIYRVDVNPGAPLPRTSRLVAVGAPTATPGQQPVAVDVSTIRLSRGRTVTGQVIASDGERPLASVMVRYFRVVELNRVNTHLLLAEATTDANGFYSVSLPTR